MASGVRRVRIDLAPNLKGVAGGYASPHVAETTLAILNRATVLAPKKTGNLANGHQMTMKATRNAIIGRVENRVEYFMPVHEGSRGFTISARRKKALAFFWPKVGAVTIVPKRKGGGTGYRKSKRKGVRFFISKGYVTIPRRKGRPFLVRAAEQEAVRRGFKFTPGGVSAATGQF